MEVNCGSLSAPEGFSVNDGIARDRCSLTYITVDEVAERALQLGQGAQLAKVDTRIWDSVGPNDI